MRCNGLQSSETQGVTAVTGFPYSPHDVRALETMRKPRHTCHTPPVWSMESVPKGHTAHARAHPEPDHPSGGSAPPLGGRADNHTFLALRNPLRRNGFQGRGHTVDT